MPWHGSSLLRKTPRLLDGSLTITTVYSMAKKGPTVLERDSYTAVWPDSKRIEGAVTKSKLFRHEIRPDMSNLGLRFT